MAEQGGRTPGRVEERSSFPATYLLERPLLRAITRREGPPVLLIDEIDRADDGFEAFLLEVLSDFQVTIPELGTIRPSIGPYVILTSNRTREIGDALRRRCLYLYIEHPSLEKEVRIIRARVPGAAEQLAGEIGRFLQALRERRLLKAPGRRRDDRLGAGARAPRTAIASTRETVEQTLGCLLKDQHDLAERPCGAAVPRSSPHAGRGWVSGLDLVAHARAASAGRCASAACAWSLGDEIDAVAALTLVDLLGSRRGAARAADRAEDPPARRGDVRRALRALVERRRLAGSSGRRRRALSTRSGACVAFGGLPARAAPAEPEHGERLEGDTPGYSPRGARCGASPSTSARAADLAAMERLLARLALDGWRRGGAAAWSRRAGRGRVDLRRSFRARRRDRRRAPAPGPPRPRDRATRGSSSSATPAARWTRTRVPAGLPARAEEGRAADRALRVQHVARAPHALDLAGQAAADARAAGRRRAGLVGRHAHRRLPDRVRRRATATNWSIRRTVVVIVSDGLDRGRPGRPGSRDAALSGPGRAVFSGSTRCSGIPATSRRPGAWRRRCRSWTSSPRRTTSNRSSGCCRSPLSEMHRIRFGVARRRRKEGR